MRSSRTSRSQAPAKKPLLLRPVLWLSGVALLALAGLIQQTIEGAPAQVVDVPAAKDAVRHGSDIRATASEVITDNSRMRVLPSSFRFDDKALHALSRPGGATDPAASPALYKGVNFETMKIKILLEGRRAEDLVITSVEPVVIERSRPLQGILMDIPAQGVDADLSAFLDFDTSDPILREAIKPEQSFPDEYVLPSAGGPFLADRSISLQDGEHIVINIQAKTLRHYYSFEFRLTYMKGGHTYHEIVDNNGKPFELTGARCGPQKHTLSYTKIYELQADWSVTPAAHPQAFRDNDNGKFCG